MQAPRFWYAPSSVASTLLLPLGAIYGCATARRVASGRPQAHDIPVICVGNINAGGTGKTPTVIALIQYFQSLGITPHVVSRGYGGSLNTVTQVDPVKHSADQTGDEPLLMAAFAPTWICPNRALGITAASLAGADVVVLDDGHQDPSVVKDLSLVVVDAKRGFGNGRCIPAGPLREPVAAGIKRADAVIAIGSTAHQDQLIADHALPCAVVRAKVQPLQMGMDWSDGRYIAFAGIGYPEKFFDTLRGLGADLVATHALDDHQPLSRGLMQRLSADAQTHGAQLVTTEKDAVRLPRDFMGQVLALPVRLEFDDISALKSVLQPVLTRLAQSDRRSS